MKVFEVIGFLICLFTNASVLYIQFIRIEYSKHFYVIILPALFLAVLILSFVIGNHEKVIFAFILTVVTSYFRLAIDVSKSSNDIFKNTSLDFHKGAFNRERLYILNFGGLTLFQAIFLFTSIKL